MYNSKRAISPVVATALLIVVGVVAVVGFQTFFNTYSSGLFTKVDTQSDASVGGTQIDNLIGNSLYFKNSNTENITINSIKIEGNDCNYSGNASTGINEISITSCISDLTTSTPEVVIYTNNGIYSKKFYVKLASNQTSFSSCTLNGTTVNHGDSYSFYNSSSVSYGSSCSSEARTCTDGTLNGTSSYNVSSCDVLSLDCSALGLAGGIWATIPGNSSWNTSDFCVMKFESKFVNSTGKSDSGYNTYRWDSATGDMNITSNYSGYPITYISQTQSKTACSSLGSNYHLITNNEWMTIMRNIELNSQNWNSSIIGTGFIYSGHNDNSPGLALQANESDFNNYFGTSNSAPSNQRRTFNLSNGQIIWDVSGNVWEWNNDTCDNTIWQNTGAGAEWNTANIADIEKTIAGPFGNYTSTNGVGTYWACNPTNNAFRKSGAWDSSIHAGIYATYLSDTTSAVNQAAGFRCVYTP